MITSRLAGRVFILLTFCCAYAQTTTEKQTVLDGIIARAHANPPQSHEVTMQQLNDWAAKYKGTLQVRVVPGPPPTKEALAKVCSATFEIPGGTCRLTSAWSEKGKMTCHYACS